MATGEVAGSLGKTGPEESSMAAHATTNPTSGATGMTNYPSDAQTDLILLLKEVVITWCPYKNVPIRGTTFLFGVSMNQSTSI